VVAHDTPATADARPNLLKLCNFPTKGVMRLSARDPSQPESLTVQGLGLKPWNENPHTHEQEKSRRSPGPTQL
jgi:hypothetical protein